MRTRAGVLIGREAELAAAWSRVQDSARGGGGPACFWIGEPGVGKSRLRAEVAERAGVDGLVVVQGRASAMGPVSPLRPFAEALASVQRRGLLPDDPLDGYRALLARVLPQLSGPGDAGLETPPILAFAEAVLRVLTVLGGERGCLLILEDLHDADPESLVVLEYLLDNITGTPVAVLGALRDEPSSARDLLTAAELRGAAQLQPIRSLDQPATSALIAACLRCDRPSPQLAELIWRNSGGNPLMVEELLYDLIDKGQLSWQDGDLRVSANPVLAPPPSMLQLIGLRLNRMEQVARRVLVAAAVYGEHFPVATVATAVVVDESEIWDAVQVGLAQQLIVAEMPGWYRFHHPLTHAAVLELAGQAERRQAAARMAEAVLAEDPQQAAATCRLAARLFAEAGKPVAAGRLYARSGREALRNNAVEWAVADLSEAFRLAPSQLDVIGDLVPALLQAGQLDRALELADRLGLPGDALDGEVLIGIHLALTRGCYGAGRMEQTGMQLARARELAAGLDDELLRLHCDAVAAGLTYGPTHAANADVERVASTVADAAERLARTANDATRRQEAAEVACQAWIALISALWSQERIQELGAYLQRIDALISRFQLPRSAFNMRYGEVMIRLVTDGDELPMRLMRDDARRLGAVRRAVELDMLLLGHQLMVGEGSLAPVMAALTQHLEQGERIGDRVQRDLALSALLMGASLRADRPALTALLARCQPATSVVPTLVEGDVETAQAICLALEGRDGEALTKLEGFAQRDQPGPYYDSYPVGPLLLLATMAGTASSEQVTEALHAFSGRRWTRQFLHWAAAVHVGRQGDLDAAASHAEQAAKAAEIYPVPRHLAARLIAPAAAADGWGSPIEDLRAAEAWFHHNDIPAAARSCRDVLRTLGAPVLHRRAGTDTVPSQLRAAGVTAREYEISLLLREHLDNRAIAQRLHISHRTVEKHIATLLAKLCVPNRRALTNRIIEIS